ncbi:hypothetical protein Sjap_015129 [Stephania japonica]|uniref:Uncharacterized protein n=1 Tax=Stephania japonica TaxID=461633 RepID=A0AAP0NQJ5_9MAGN
MPVSSVGRLDSYDYCVDLFCKESIHESIRFNRDVALQEASPEGGKTQLELEELLKSNLTIYVYWRCLLAGWIRVLEVFVGVMLTCHLGSECDNKAEGFKNPQYTSSNPCGTARGTMGVKPTATPTRRPRQIHRQVRVVGSILGTECAETGPEGGKTQLQLKELLKSNSTIYVKRDSNHRRRDWSENLKPEACANYEADVEAPEFTRRPGLYYNDHHVESLILSIKPRHPHPSSKTNLIGALV